MSKRPEQLEQLTAYLDDELSAEDRARVERLLESDGEARALLEDLRRTANFVRRLPRGSAPPDLAERVNVRLERAALLGESARGIPATTVRRPRWIRPFAIAASLLLACTIGWLGYMGQMSQMPEIQVAFDEGSRIPSEPTPVTAPPPSLAIREGVESKTSASPEKWTADRSVGGLTAARPAGVTPTYSVAAAESDQNSSAMSATSLQGAAPVTPVVSKVDADAGRYAEGREPLSAFEQLFTPRFSTTASTAAAIASGASYSSANQCVILADPATAKELASCISEFARGNLLVASAESVKDTSRFLGQPYCIEPPAAATTSGLGGFGGGRPSDSRQSVRYVLSVSESQLPQLAAAMDRVALGRGDAPAITVNGASVPNMQLAALSVRPSRGELIDAGSLGALNTHAKHRSGVQSRDHVAGQETLVVATAPQPLEQRDLVVPEAAGDEEAAAKRVQSPGRLRSTSAARPTDSEKSEAEGMPAADGDDASLATRRAIGRQEQPPEAKVVTPEDSKQDNRENGDAANVKTPVSTSQPPPSPPVRLIQLTITIVPADENAGLAAPVAIPSSPPASPQPTAPLHPASQPATQESQRGQG